jgi:hypothetical protein
MARTFQITGVRTEPGPDGRHEHISHVRIGTSTGVLSRQTVVNDLRDPNGDRYFTSVNGQRANVIVVSCPACSFRDYLRTDADSTTTNHLLSLPRV